MECLLMVKGVYHLPLRATEGFAQSLCALLKVEVPIPDYTTLCRRAKTLTVALPTTATGPIHAVLDSSGLKVFGEGEWKVRKHGYSKRRTWRKLHLNVDEATGEIQAEELTEASVDDAAMVEPLLEQTEAAVEQLSADGAYDKEKVYTTAQTQGVATVTIPPRRDARMWQHGKCAAPPHPRDVNLRRIRDVGREQWKEASGYHRRSLAETTMFRSKTIFGDHLDAREVARQKTEARIKCAALNRMTRLRMPDSYRVA
jgi:IS5 family transposase